MYPLSTIIQEWLGKLRILNSVFVPKPTPISGKYSMHKAYTHIYRLEVSQLEKQKPKGVQEQVGLES